MHFFFFFCGYLMKKQSTLAVSSFQSKGGEDAHLCCVLILFLLCSQPLAIHTTTMDYYHGPYYSPQTRPRSPNRIVLIFPRVVAFLTVFPSKSGFLRVFGVQARRRYCILLIF
jgi:hypothetical protein